METVATQIGGAAITLTKDGLTISLARSHWSARHWAWLVHVLAQVLEGGLAWVLAPTVRAAAAPAAGSPAPRWKPLVIDGLSYLLFVLLIPPGHPLRQLYAAYDWATIDAQCAEVYKNQVRGAPAYAPQVLFRILVLMFVSGTPFESVTLVRLQTDVAWRWFVGLSLLHNPAHADHRFRWMPSTCSDPCRPVVPTHGVQFFWNVGIGGRHGLESVDGMLQNPEG